MDLILFTSSKKRAECAPMEAIVSSVARKFKKELHTSVLDIEERANRLTALQFRVSSPPALVLDGEPIFADKLPTEEELTKAIEAKAAEYGKSRKEGRSRHWSVSGLPENWAPER